MHKAGSLTTINGGLIIVCLGFSGILMLATMGLIQPEITLLDMTEKETNGYKTIHIKLDGIEEKPNNVSVSFTNGLVSDKTNTIMEMEHGLMLVTVFYPLSPLDEKSFEIVGVGVDNWFIPVKTENCPSMIEYVCTTANLNGEIAPDVTAHITTAYILLAGMLFIGLVCIAYPKDELEEYKNAIEYTRGSEHE